MNVNLKILFVLGFPNPFPGAAWTRVGFFATHWSRKGHLIEVLGAFGYRSLRKRGVRKVENVNIFNIIPNVGVISLLAFVLNTLISFLVSVIFLLVRKPNIIIISVPPGDVGIGAIMACKLLRAKYIIDYRDEWEDYAISIVNNKLGKFFFSVIKKIATTFYLHSRLITTVTPNFRRILIGRGLRNVMLVTNGVDITIFKPYDKAIIRSKLGLCMNDFIIAYNGTIGNYYRLDVVIRALKKLNNNLRDKVKLLIVGSGPDLSKTIHIAKELGLENNILYLGEKNDKKELAEILSAADAGIIPYDDNPLWRNSVPTKFYEYCACGLPIIATIHDDSLLGKLIKKYQVGVISPPLDEGKLAEIICYVYGNKSFRLAASSKARLLIEKEFDRNKISEEFLNLVREVIGCEIK